MIIKINPGIFFTSHDTPQKLTIDIDCEYSKFIKYWDTLTNANVIMNKFLESIVFSIQIIIYETYKITISPEHISIEDGSRVLNDIDYKFSYHIKLQKIVFANSTESRYVSDLVCEHLKVTYPGDFISRIYDKIIKQNYTSGTTKNDKKITIITNHIFADTLITNFNECRLLPCHNFGDSDLPANRGANRGANRAELDSRDCFSGIRIYFKNSHTTNAS